MWSYFTFKNIIYNIRNGPLLKLPDAKSTNHGINSILGHAYCGMVFPSLLNIKNTSLNWKENLKNREMLTVLVFYVDEVNNKIFIVFLLVLISISGKYGCKSKSKNLNLTVNFINTQEPSLREKCPDTEFFLVRIFPHSDWIRRDTI